MIDWFIFLIVGCIFIASHISCATYRKEMQRFGNTDDLIQNAIIDFVNTENSLMKQDDYFHVFKDELDSCTITIIGAPNKIPLILEAKHPETMVVDYKDKIFIARETLRDVEIITVDFTRSGDSPKIWFREDAVDISYMAIPDHVVESHGKLFFWYGTSNQQIHDSTALQLLFDYKYVDTLVQHMYWPDMIIDDGKQGVSYTFPDADLMRYRKQKTRHI